MGSVSHGFQSGHPAIPDQHTGITAYREWNLGDLDVLRSR